VPSPASGTRMLPPCAESLIVPLEFRDAFVFDSDAPVYRYSLAVTQFHRDGSVGNTIFSQYGQSQHSCPQIRRPSALERSGHLPFRRYGPLPESSQSRATSASPTFRSTRAQQGLKQSHHQGPSLRTRPMTLNPGGVETIRPVPSSDRLFRLRSTPTLQGLKQRW